uniref:FYN binding protein b n=1 Tax=Sinocyclocheilus rhinocerous TaxID=307959 RepID=A0A673NAD5_9TELE
MYTLYPAIMARFQAGSVSTEGTPGVRPKPPVQPTLSSGPAVATKKPVLESSLSGGVTTTSIAPKPKSTVNTARSAPDMHGPPKLKAFGTRFENTQENNKVNFKVPVKPKPPDSSQYSETPKVPFPKVPLQKPPSNIMANDSKVTSPKPMAPMAKPPWVKDAPKAEDNSTSPNPTPPKMPSAPKPKSTMAMLRQQPEESSNVESAAKPSIVSNVKPSSFRVKNSFIKREEGVKEGAKVPSANESVSKPVASNKPNITRKSSGPPIQTANDDPSAPKKKPLPNTYALGSAPAKPNRPPKVNLEKFKKGSEATTERPKNVTPPPPPASHPSSQPPPPLPSQPLRPNLPPRHPGPMSAAEPSQPQKKQEKELKNQKEREKKEKDAIKKFKITTPLQVIHQVKAKADCKGGKYDLSIKKGESIDIIRITDNPEGKWLGRSQDGSFGYVKTEMVEIDFSVLKNKGLALPHSLENEEVYDDPVLMIMIFHYRSLPQMISKVTKVHEDPKKQKKFEEKEKEFRKKFKYDGEIQVLHQAMIATSKKGSGKDLTVQAGETVDVISKSDPDKFICRNKEGKYCIYDND